MGETGWVGYRTLKELDLPNVNDALFLDQIRSAVEHAVIEPNTAKVDKVIPRQVFDVWHAVMSAVHQEGVRFTLKDMGKPIPFLTFPDKTGREFALDSGCLFSYQLMVMSFSHVIGQSTSRNLPSICGTVTSRSTRRLNKVSH